MTRVNREEGLWHSLLLTEYKILQLPEWTVLLLMGDIMWTGPCETMAAGGFTNDLGLQSNDKVKHVSANI